MSKSEPKPEAPTAPVPGSAAGTETCVCGCGEAVQGRSVYAGRTEAEKASHRVRALREREAADKIRQRALQARTAALSEVGLDGATLSQLADSLAAYVAYIGHLASAITDGAADCDEQAVERRIRQAREGDRSTVVSLQRELRETHAALDRLTVDNRGLRQLADEAEAHAAKMSRLALDQREQLDRSASILEDVNAQAAEFRQRLATLQSENRHLGQLVHQQNLLLGVHYAPEEVPSQGEEAMG